MLGVVSEQSRRSSRRCLRRSRRSPARRGSRSARRSPTRRGELVVGGAADDPGSGADPTLAALIAPPTAHGARTSHSAVIASEGSSPLRSRSSASPSPGVEVRERAALHPASARRSRQRSPTCPVPTIATRRPPRSTCPRHLADAARIAASTPSAVNGLGSPEPPCSMASARDMLGPLTDRRQVVRRGADVLGGDVAAVERLDEIAEVQQQVARARVPRALAPDARSRPCRRRDRGLRPRPCTSSRPRGASRRRRPRTGEVVPEADPAQGGPGRWSGRRSPSSGRCARRDDHELLVLEPAGDLPGPVVAAGIRFPLRIAWRFTLSFLEPSLIRPRKRAASRTVEGPVIPRHAAGTSSAGSRWSRASAVPRPGVSRPPRGRGSRPGAG